MKNKDEYWIIDPDVRDRRYDAVGPYQTQQEAEKEFIWSCKEFWKRAGGVLRDTSLTSEGKPYLIVKVVRRVLPDFGDEVTIKDVEATEDAEPQHHCPKKLSEEELHAFATKVAECIQDVRSTLTGIKRSDSPA